MYLFCQIFLYTEYTKNMCKECNDYSVILYLWINENLINKNAKMIKSFSHILYRSLTKI